MTPRRLVFLQRPCPGLNESRRMVRLADRHEMSSQMATPCDHAIERDDVALSPPELRGHQDDDGDGCIPGNDLEPDEILGSTSSSDSPTRAKALDGTRCPGGPPGRHLPHDIPPAALQPLRAP
jgi:hypothetical protein